MEWKSQKHRCIQIAEKVGSVFQNPRSQFFNTDTDSEIAFGMENLAWPLEKMLPRVKETLKAINIDNLSGRGISQLSGGEQQRVSIARALAKNPKLMLCDEPTGALDYNTGKAILKLLQDTCRQQGMTVIVITHNSALAPMADRLDQDQEWKVQAWS